MSGDRQAKHLIDEHLSIFVRADAGVAAEQCVNRVALGALEVLPAQHRQAESLILALRV